MEAKDYLKKVLDKHDNEAWTDKQVAEAMEGFLESQAPNKGMISDEVKTEIIEGIIDSFNQVDFGNNTVEREANSLFEWMRSKLSPQETSDNWISVKDELPERDSSVIFGSNDITDINNRLCEPMVTSGWYDLDFYSYLTKDKLKPKYWMYMPVLKNGQTLPKDIQK